ncbi:MAG: hypothetical protein JW902_01915, partial [Syntrophaceae bacterium]|nr:hypothetical protein [Syntrophaceae bacterium]
MARRKNKKSIKVGDYKSTKNDSARSALNRLLNLRKAKFQTVEEQTKTQAIEVSADKTGITADDKDPDLTSGYYWKQKWEEDRIVSIQNQ